MPIRVIRALAAAAVLAMLSGCTHYALVPPAAPVTVRGAMTVKPGIEWNQLTQLGADDTGTVDFWTVDGEQLNMLILLSGVENDRPLFNITKSSEKPPRYRAGMATEELAALFESAFTKTFRAKVFTLVSLKPETVAGGEGLRLTFSFSGEDEVDRDGVAVATQRNGKLYLIAHIGTRLHYQPKFAPEFERIVASMRIIDKG